MSRRITDVVRTSCRGCHGVCQVLVHMEGERVVKVSGDPESPTSRGFLCAKGQQPSPRYSTIRTG